MIYEWHPDEYPDGMNKQACIEYARDAKFSRPELIESYHRRLDKWLTSMEDSEEVFALFLDEDYGVGAMSFGPSYGRLITDHAERFRGRMTWRHHDE